MGRMISQLLRAKLDELDGSCNPHWPRDFWNFVNSLPGLSDTLKGVLRSHGYTGGASQTMPRVDELKEALKRYELSGPAGGGSGGLSGTGGDLPQLTGESSWHNQLPADFRRAGYDIYKNIRASGSASIRDWLNHNYTGDKAGPDRPLDVGDTVGLHHQPRFSRR